MQLFLNLHHIKYFLMCALNLMLIFMTHDPHISKKLIDTTVCNNM